MAALLDPCLKATYIKNEKVDDIEAGALEEIKFLLTQQQLGPTGTLSAPPGVLTAAANKPK